MSPMFQFNGERAARIRLVRGLTQEDVASEVAVSARTVRFWEAGQSKPSPYCLRRLAIVLECNDGDFYDATDAPIPRRIPRFVDLVTHDEEQG